MQNLKHSFKKLLVVWLRTTLSAAISFYKYFLSPFLGGRCRFYPSCSNYAAQAIAEKSPAQAILFILKRILACHPFGRSGFDPVPQNKEFTCQ